MPTISMFYGILIKMNWRDMGQHSCPHIHAYYGEHEAVFGFDGEIISGKFPKKQAQYVKTWMLIHEDELNANWQLAVKGEEIYRIDPLR